jgi:hypothetical protein
MQRMDLFENPFEYSEWDESNYTASDLNVTLSCVELGGTIMSDPSYAGFMVKITYGMEYNLNRIFVFYGVKKYSIPKTYVSMHLLSFLLERALKEFHDEAQRRKRQSLSFINGFILRTVDEFFDDLMDALSVIRLEANK